MHTRFGLGQCVQHAHVVAARYGKGPQHLVGPELFAWWLFAVKAGLMVLVAVHVLLLMVSVFSVQREACAPQQLPPLVVRDARGQWTASFLSVRADMGMPPRP